MKHSLNLASAMMQTIYCHFLGVPEFEMEYGSGNGTIRFSQRIETQNQEWWASRLVYF